MALDDTTLVEEVKEITGKGALPVHFEWSAQIILPNKKGTITPFRVNGFDIVRDYDANYCDEMFIDVTMEQGTYQQLIIPNATNLLLTLTRNSVLEGGDGEDLNTVTIDQTYRATLIKQSSAAVEGNNSFSATLADGNLTSMLKVTFQLLDMAVEQTRMQTLGTVLQQSTVGDAITYLVTKVAQSLVVDEAHRIKGVTMVTPNNTKVYQHIVVQHNTRAVDVPRYIAYHTGAPYSSGFGAYLQQSIWYLYPLFDLKLYDKAQKTLTIINLPKNRMPQSERTYRTTPNQLIVLATEESRHVDVSEALQLSLGNGTRYADASKTFDGFVSVKDNTAIAQRVDNANEYVVQSRDTGFNNVQASDKRITSNTFNEMSKLAPRLGSLIVSSWVNSDPNLIFPGMPVKYVYEVNGKVFELRGQVIRTQSQTASVMPGIYPGPHRSTTAITMFVEKILTWNTPDATAAKINTI